MPSATALAFHHMTGACFLLYATDLGLSTDIQCAGLGLVSVGVHEREVNVALGEPKRTYVMVWTGWSSMGL